MVVILLLNVMKVFSVGEVEVPCWIDRVWASKECACWAWDFRFVCRKLAPHLVV